ncbi:XRE family transcriptional regulator [Paracoccus simplex]|uniref:XRE family transcriptional regulator n=1 Tax=Paracoccus simplex TaxID=2086346 RepID=A0ABV7RYR4_9RHOB
MNLEQKTALAHVNDMGLAATAIRLRAAFIVSGLKRHQDLADASGVSKTVLSNAMAGSTYPNRDLLKYLHRAHRIDFNFMMNGDFAQLPGDVQDRLFAALEVANNEWDQREDSGRSQAAQRTSQQRT